MSSPAVFDAPHEQHPSSVAPGAPVRSATAKVAPMNESEQQVVKKELEPKAPALISASTLSLLSASTASRAYDHHQDLPHLEQESVEDTYSLLLQTLLIVCAIIAAKLCMREYIPWKGFIDLSEISLVFTGLFFLLGIMFSNVNADLKEAEKMPMEIVSSLDQLEDSFILAASKIVDDKNKAINVNDARRLCLWFAQTWHAMLYRRERPLCPVQIKYTMGGAIDNVASALSTGGVVVVTDNAKQQQLAAAPATATLSSYPPLSSSVPPPPASNVANYGDCLHVLSEMVTLVAAWDKKGAANTAPVLAIIDKLRRLVARGTVVQRTEVLPAARAILNYFVLMSSVLLFLATYKTEVALAIVMACVMTVCVFMARLISAMDDPFYNMVPSKYFIVRFFKGHMATIQVFPIIEYTVRMERRLGVVAAEQQVADDKKQA